MEDANGRRVKLWGTARVVEGDSGLQERLRDPEYPGEVERAIFFSVEGWDVNYQRHIHERFSRRQVAPVIEGLRAGIASLESEVESLRSGQRSDGET